MARAPPSSPETSTEPLSRSRCDSSDARPLFFEFDRLRATRAVFGVNANLRHASAALRHREGGNELRLSFFPCIKDVGVLGRSAIGIRRADVTAEQIDGR